MEKSFIVSTKILISTTVFNIGFQEHFLLLLNQHIKMISKESRDTENCSNGCWKCSFAMKLYFIWKYIENWKQLF